MVALKKSLEPCQELRGGLFCTHRAVADAISSHSVIHPSRSQTLFQLYSQFEFNAANDDSIFQELFSHKRVVFIGLI